MIQLIAALLIITACTFLAICTGTFKNPFIQLLLAGFMAVILSNETPTLPVILWSVVFGLTYVLCVDWMVERFLSNDIPHPPHPSKPQPEISTPHRHEQSIHDLFEFEPLGDDQ